MSPKDSRVEFNVESSSYKIKLNFALDLIMSLMLILNNNGPIIDPCGTPVVIDSTADFTSPIVT